MSAHRDAMILGERVGMAWELLPPRKLQSVSGGARDGRRAGGSLEFRDYRDYQLGDDLRHLDWSVFARSDKLTVRQFHEEVSPIVDLIVDGSKSMALEGSRKSEVALALSAMLATAAQNAGFPYVFSIARDHLVTVAKGHVKASTWNDVDFAFSGDPSGALLRGAPMLRPLGVRIFLSDLLWPADPSPLLKALAAQAASLIIIEVLAADDALPDLIGNYRLTDCETDEYQDIVFDAAAAAAYQTALYRHRELWDAAARESGALLLRCVADELGPELLFADLAEAEILGPA